MFCYVTASSANEANEANSCSTAILNNNLKIRDLSYFFFFLHFSIQVRLRDL